MKPLLVGEAPRPPQANPTGQPRGIPLYPYPVGCAGWRLQQFSGMEKLDYINTFDKMNLMDHFTAGWSIVAAREAWTMRVKPQLAGRPAAVLFGLRVNEASGLRIPIGQHIHIGDTRVFNLPHPSGRNPWWNMENNRLLGRRVMQMAAGRVEMADA